VRLEHVRDETVRSRNKRSRGDTRQCANHEERVLLDKEGADQVEDSQSRESICKDILGRVEIGEPSPEQEESGEGDRVRGLKRSVPQSLDKEDNTHDNPRLLFKANAEVNTNGVGEKVA
jgi:hypothetical protein